MKLNSCSVSLQTPRWAHFFVIYKCQFKTNKNRTTIADPYVPRSIFPSHLSMGLFFRTFATSAQSRQKVKTQTNMPDKGRRPGPLCKKFVCGCVGPGDALGVARKRRRKEKKTGAGNTKGEHAKTGAKMQKPQSYALTLKGWQSPFWTCSDVNKINFA